MHILSRSPSEAYRRVELDARIAASARQDLTRICLEEAVAALGIALHSLERDPARVPGEPLARAHSILAWLASSVAADHPLRDHLRQFYGAQVALLARCMARPSRGELEQARTDLTDLLEAAA